MTKKYRNVVRAVFDRPWVITPAKMDAIAELIQLRSQGEQLSGDEIALAIGNRRTASAPQPTGGAVAVLNVFGVLSHRMGMMEQVSGGTSTEALGKAFDAAVNDPGVGHIVLQIDSPGGSAFGVQEVADKVYAARGKKPITAMVNSVAGSGAYWIASAADEIIVTPSGMVGSIGALMMHRDTSAMKEELGIKDQIFRMPAGKAEGAGGEPLSEDEVSHRMQMVSDLYDTFVDAVAQNRGVTSAAVKSGYGQGRMVDAGPALEAGMADRIATWDQVVAELTTGSLDQGNPIMAQDQNKKPQVDATDAITEDAQVAATVTSDTADVNDVQIDVAADVNASEILAACKLATNLDAGEQLDLAQQLISDSTPLEQAISAISARQADKEKEVGMTDVDLGAVTPGPSERDKFYASARNAVLGRMLSGNNRVKEIWNYQTQSYEEWTQPRIEYRLSSLPRLAEECLIKSGANPAQLRNLAPAQIAQLALGLSDPRTFGLQMSSDGPAYNTTSDFANLLLDAANVGLRQSYNDANTTFQVWMRQAESLADFKAVNKVIAGEMGDPKAIPEDGEFEETSMSDGKESYKLTVWGQVFSISWQSVVNDQLSAFTEAPTKLGRAMRRKQNRLAYAVLKDNAAMADTNALFDDTNHGNDVTSGAAPGTAQMNTMTQKMMEQTGLDADSGFLNLMPTWVIVPPALRGTTLEWLASTANPAAGGSAAGSSGVANIWQNGLSPIVEAELSAASSGGSDAIWYAAADNRDIDTIEYAYLQGLETPVLEQAAAFDRLAVRQRIYQAFAVKAIDWRGLVRNAGA